MKEDSMEAIRGIRHLLDLDTPADIKIEMIRIVVDLVLDHKQSVEPATGGMKYGVPIEHAVENTTRPYRLTGSGICRYGIPLS